MAELILTIIAAGGLLGVAALMFAENLFPPIPSEVILPLAGYAAARGDLPLAGVILAATLGAVAGAAFWKAVGRTIPEAGLRRWVDRHGRWLALEVSDLDRAQAFFRRWGGLAVFLGRLAPGIRTLISLPAGVLRMPWGVFLAWTTAGTFLWTLALTLAGVFLASRHDQVAAWLDKDTVLSAGGDNWAIHLWSPRTRVGRSHGALRGFGQDLHDVMIDSQGQLRFNTVPQRMRPPTASRKYLSVLSNTSYGPTYSGARGGNVPPRRT